MIADAAQRQAALNPLASFCVSAPAGSGKTELLIQRQLALLARVEQPEQVVAITFTRKAAAEMRERLVEALHAARAGTPVTSDHQRQTRSLAEAALVRDREQQWLLCENTNRLNIRTIDGFCASLTRQMPVLSTFGGQAVVIEDARPLYAEAVAGLFGRLGENSALASDLAGLLLQFDNNWERLQALLMSLLARRDQWAAYIGVHHSPDESEAYLLQAVDQVVAETLCRAQVLLEPFAEQLLPLWRYARDNQSAPPLAGWPSTDPEALDDWGSLAGLLLTKSGDWRKQVTVREGFPAGKGEATERKEAFKALLNELREAYPELPDLLADILLLPSAQEHGPGWQLALQLSHVLPHLAAQLLLVFQRHGRVDHSQVALSALQALGEDDNPTELALRLDYQIEHILVDEFQDTAINQYTLVQRLTRGWHEHNQSHPQQPRTLMVVGDGMQSIYGFRDANVGLFLKARNEGFNGLSLEPLQLLCNFRSQQGIVAWVNDTFQRAFPTRDNTSRGEVGFTRASPVAPALSGSSVEVQAFAGEGAAEAEAHWICGRIGQLLDVRAVGTIAILGRSRAQLQPVLAALQAADIPFGAQSLDRLADSPAVLDLLSLCRVLANPADRVAWLAVLRAPWCGLTLADLHALAGNRSVLARQLNDDAALARLSNDGLERVQHLARCLASAQSKRDRLHLRVWLEQLWLALGGPASLPDPAMLADAERFFQLLEEADIEGIGLDVDWLAQRLDSLYADHNPGDCPLQVMTLHKSKGLEFDHVFIPKLGSPTRGDERPLLLWDEYTTDTGDRHFLLSADDLDKDGQTLYNYLRAQSKRKQRLETTRLLYVGATRAVQRLYLSATLGYDADKDRVRAPGEGSLAARIWSSFESQMQLNVIDAPATIMREQVLGLHRLHSVPRSEPISASAGVDPNIPPPRLNHRDRSIGTVVHLALERLAGYETLPVQPDAQLLQVCSSALRQAGLSDHRLKAAMARVEEQVRQVLTDDTGRWLLDSSHPKSRSEYPLAWFDGMGVRNLVIDRCFVDQRDGRQWIIDYKSSAPMANETLEAFLQREADTYRPQLARYDAALQAEGASPAHCALYFTALGVLHPVTTQLRQAVLEETAWR